MALIMNSQAYRKEKKTLTQRNLTHALSPHSGKVEWLRNLPLLHAAFLVPQLSWLNSISVVANLFLQDIVNIQLHWGEVPCVDNLSRHRASVIPLIC